MKLRIATWNINSIRIRLHHIAQLVKEESPDIICLQETKVEDGSFPLGDIQALGFEHIHISGQKSYNGVALLSRVKLSDVHAEPFLGREDRRHISAVLPGGIELHNFYVPAGGDIPDPEVNDKFDHKLRFMDALGEWSDKQNGKPIIMVGDMNIAPLPTDVWSHKQLLSVVSHTPIEVEKMEALRATQGWVDAIRKFTPVDEKIYSWWSYRNRDWKESNRGRRLDHIWVTPPLQDTLKSAHILRHARDWVSPSDHVPVIAELHA